MRKMRRSAVLGSDCSLKNSLMPSAALWNKPNGPARSGPIRFCILAMTLRRNQMYMSTESSSSTKTAIVLPMMISTTVVSSPLSNSGSASASSPLHRVVSTRSSVTDDAMSMMSLGPTSPRCANAMNPVPGAVAESASTATVMVPRRARDADVVAFGAHADAFEVARVDDDATRRRERGERRARRHDAPGVVQRAGGHEAETVRVGRRRRGGRHGAVPHVQCRARLELLDRALDRSLRGTFVLRRVAGGQAGLDGDVGAGAAGRDRTGTQRREVRLVGRDAGRNRLPRAAGGRPRARAGTRSRRGSRRSAAPRRRGRGG